MTAPLAAHTPKMQQSEPWRFEQMSHSGRNSKAAVTLDALANAARSARASDD